MYELYDHSQAVLGSDDRKKLLRALRREVQEVLDAAVRDYNEACMSRTLQVGQPRQRGRWVSQGSAAAGQIGQPRQGRPGLIV